ncbi:hypothetical protein UUU_26380 (plasmid) [Klebsiella pneumoniae subsp. pneumoniae DSM 30104 = JCM 1662 = NBRC 14940]|nr:hypothetical protein UUU_26380 [Klebsiella pneumoniae subsp. pneumoniae DSM 30104 = JCM 1662 = NBRC 14940]
MAAHLKFITIKPFDNFIITQSHINVWHIKVYSCTATRKAPQDL